MTKQEAIDMLDRIAKGIAEMFGTNCETVVNDLDDATHPILAIYNGHVSGREVGSTLDVTGVEQDLCLDSDVLNLLAVTPNGQQTKSSTFSRWSSSRTWAAFPIGGPCPLWPPIWGYPATPCISIWMKWPPRSGGSRKSEKRRKHKWSRRASKHIFRIWPGS